MRIVGKGETVEIMEALSVTHMDAEWVFYYELRTNSGAMGAGQWMDAYCRRVGKEPEAADVDAVRRWQSQQVA